MFPLLQDLGGGEPRRRLLILSILLVVIVAFVSLQTYLILIGVYPPNATGAE